MSAFAKGFALVGTLLVAGIFLVAALIPSAIDQCQDAGTSIDTGSVLTIYDHLPYLTEDQAAALAESAGLPGRAFGQLSLGESNYGPPGTPVDPKAVGHDPGGTIGLGIWQVTTGFNTDIITRFGGHDAMFTPSVNALATKAIFDRQGIGAWYGTRFLTDPDAHYTDPVPPGRLGATARDHDAGSTGTRPVDDAPASSTPRDDDGTSHIAWPTEVKTITSPFGGRASPGGIGSTNHMGVDIGAPMGADVHAAADGTVTQRGMVGGYGNYLCLRHSQQMTTCYAHLSAFGRFQMNQRVPAGAVIGKVGSTGNSTGPHLHFEVRLGPVPSSAATDPQPYLTGAAEVADGSEAAVGCGGPATEQVETVVVGDSLAVGMDSPLKSELDGWSLTTFAQRGRRLADARGLMPAPGTDRVIAMSLGTNDERDDTAGIRSANRAALEAAGTGGCVVWATVYRDGRSSTAMNEEIRARGRADTRVHIVDWARYAAEHPERIGGDGTHPTPLGYRARAKMYADAIRECAPAAPGDPASGLADERLADTTGPVAQLRSGKVAAPAGAPEAIKRMVAAGNGIQGLTYTYGGGHDAAFTPSPGFDCSSSTSWVLHRAGLLKSPMVSGEFGRWGRPGRGKWVTIYSNAGHVFIVIAGQRLDTSPVAPSVNQEKGPRWRGSGSRSVAGFVATHPPGL